VSGGWVNIHISAITGAGRGSDVVGVGVEMAAVEDSTLEDDDCAEGSLTLILLSFVTAALVGEECSVMYSVGTSADRVCSLSLMVAGGGGGAS